MLRCEYAGSDSKSNENAQMNEPASPWWWLLHRPVAVEAEPVHGAAGTEGQRVARLIDNTSECVGAGDSCQAVLGTVAPMDQVGQVPLREHIQKIFSALFF